MPLGGAAHQQLAGEAGTHPCLRFWPLGGQAAELAVSQARRANSAP